MKYTFYCSGVAPICEIKALVDSDIHYGVSLHTLSNKSLQYMIQNPVGKIFVDSGAFAEYGKERITHREWLRKLNIYSQLANVYGKNALFVAPDCIGDQTETIIRLLRYKNKILDLLDKANVIVPLQKGSLSISAFYYQVVQILGTSNFVCGLPFKKSALNIEDYIELVQTVAPERVHFLGVSPRSQKFPYIKKVTQQLDNPPCISLDAVMFRALAGRKYGVKPLTEAQDFFRDGVRTPSEVKYLAIRHIKHEIVKENNKVV